MNRAETSRWEPESCSTWFPWTQYQSVRAGMQPSRDQALPPDPDLGLSSLGLCPCTDGLHRTLVSLLKIRALGLRLGHLLQNFPNALSAWLLGHRLFLDIHSGPLRRSIISFLCHDSQSPQHKNAQSGFTQRVSVSIDKAKPNTQKVLGCCCSPPHFYSFMYDLGLHCGSSSVFGPSYKPK